MSLLIDRLRREALARPAKSGQDRITAAPDPPTGPALTIKTALFTSCPIYGACIYPIEPAAYIFVFQRAIYLAL